jgi:hypothetical protein
MVSSVKSLSNHYDTLGVAPTASDEEISRAFAAQMLTARMRPDIAVARLAKLSVAFETLRDAAKRRAYDSSLGLGRPAPAAIPASAAPFIGLSTIDRLNRLAAASPAPAEVAPPRASTEAHVEPRIAGFIAASLRQPAQQREPELRREPPPPPPAQTHPNPTEPTFTQAGSLDFEDGRLLIGRTGATLGASVIGVAILSVVLAVPAPNPDRIPAPEARVEPALTVPLPPAAATEESAATAQAPTTVALLTAPKPQTARDAVRVANKKAPPIPPMPVDGQALATAAATLSTAQSPSLEATAEQAAAISSAVGTATGGPETTATTARLPLPDATVARTIHRIGYACGRVVSTTGIDGAADGVFKITCSSGDSYQATPVRGRYHFRRLGSH